MEPPKMIKNEKTVTFKAIRAHFGVHFWGASKRARGRPRALAGPPGQSVYFSPLVFFTGEKTRSYGAPMFGSEFKLIPDRDVLN